MSGNENGVRQHFLQARRTVLLTGFGLFANVGILGGMDIAEAETPNRGGSMPPSDAAVVGANDFDFLIGDWSVLHRRLKRRLVDDTEWIEFSGPASARKLLGGLANIDECQINLPTGPYSGATLRLFNPATQLWSIYWMDSRNPVLDPPMVGKFSDGRGLFFGADTFEGKPIRVRFIWSGITRTACRWEQAFSLDGGETWETNWHMAFTRG